MSIFFGLALISVIGRIGIRLQSYRKLLLDDFFVLFAVANLAAATALLYKNLENLYLIAALVRNPGLTPQIDPSVLAKLQTVSLQYSMAFIDVCWTCIFAIKFSFLAFFRPLINRVEHIHTYYLTVVVITFISWAFVVAEPYIVCPYFGEKACMPSPLFDGAIF